MCLSRHPFDVKQNSINISSRNFIKQFKLYNFDDHFDVTFWRCFRLILCLKFIKSSQLILKLLFDYKDTLLILKVFYSLENNSITRVKKTQQRHILKLLKLLIFVEQKHTHEFAGNFE